MDDWILTVLIVIAVLVAGGAWYLYETHIGKPRGRRKALEESLSALAEHNVDVAYDGSSKRIEQLQRIRHGATTPVSVLDLLSRDSALNEGGDWKKLTFHEGFHQGPYDDELTDEEWQFVHRRYAELVEEKTSQKVTVETHQRYLKENEERLGKLTSSYIEQAKIIAEESQKPDSERWDEEFDEKSHDDDR